MALLRVYNVIQDCNLSDPRGGQVARMFAGISYEFALNRDIIELVSDQLDALHDVGVLDFEIGDDPVMDNQAESASLFDVANSQYQFVGTVGLLGDYDTLGDAIIAFEATNSRYAVIYATVADINFGPLDALSTKPVKVMGLREGIPLNIHFELDSGVWTYDAPHLEFDYCHVISDQDNLTGFITTNLPTLAVILDSGCSLYSWSTGAIPIIDIPISSLWLKAKNDVYLQNIDIPGFFGQPPIVANDVFVWGEAIKIDQDAILTIVDPWSEIVYSADSEFPDDLNVSLRTPLTDAKLVRYQTDIIDPGVDDDLSSFYQVGCRWYNTANDTMFYCADNTIGAAVWKEFAEKGEGLFVATVGVGGDFVDAGSALQAYEDSDAKMGYIIGATDSWVDFGASNITTTKLVTLYNLLLQFTPTDGNWIVNIPSTFIDNSAIRSTGIDHGYITSTMNPVTAFPSFYVRNSGLNNWGTPSLFEYPAYWMYFSFQSSSIGIIPAQDSLIEAFTAYVELYHGRADNDVFNFVGGYQIDSILYDDETRFNNFPVPIDPTFKSSVSDAYLLNYYTNIVDPIATDDHTKFFTVGCRWYNTANDTMFYCADNTTGAAVWSEFAETGESIFYAVVGSVGDYATLGEALQAYESSDSTFAIVHCAEVVSFGVTSVVSTKRVKLTSDYVLGSLAGLEFQDGDGVWTYNGGSLILEQFSIISSATNTTGYITCTIGNNFYIFGREVKLENKGTEVPIFSLAGYFMIVPLLNAEVISPPSIVNPTPPPPVIKYPVAEAIVCMIIGYDVYFTGDTFNNVFDPFVIYDSTCTLFAPFTEYFPDSTVSLYPSSVSENLKYYTSVSDPIVSDDILKLFMVGCRWFNATNNKIWICIDNTIGAAVWNEISKVENTEFVATVGATYQYPNVSEALQAGEDSDAVSILILVMGFVNFGPSVTTNKLIEIRGGTSLVSIDMDSDAGDGVWTHNGDMLYCTHIYFYIPDLSPGTNTSQIIFTASLLMFHGYEFDFWHDNPANYFIEITTGTFFFECWYTSFAGTQKAIQALHFRGHIYGASWLYGDIIDVFAWPFGIQYDATVEIDSTFVFDPTAMFTLNKARYNQYYFNTVDPGVNDDLSKYFRPGCRWLNTINEKIWVCLDNTVGAAVWKDIPYADSSWFITTVGDSGVYPTYGAALQAFEDSSSLYAFIMVNTSTGNVDFGTSDVTTTKYVEIYGYSNGITQFYFRQGDGVWYYDAYRLKLNLVQIWIEDINTADGHLSSHNTVLYIEGRGVNSIISYNNLNPVIQLPAGTVVIAMYGGYIGPMSPDNWSSVEANSVNVSFYDRGGFACDNALVGFVFVYVRYDASTRLWDAYGVTAVSVDAYDPIVRSENISYYTNTVDPGVTDDEDHWFQLGCRWLNTTNEKVWVCLDKTVGAAVWKDIPYADSSWFITTVGDLGVYPTYGEALLEFEASSSLYAFIMVNSSTGDIDFGPLNVTTTKSVEIFGRNYGAVSQFYFRLGDGIWYYDGPSPLQLTDINLAVDILNIADGFLSSHGSALRINYNGGGGTIYSKNNSNPVVQLPTGIVIIASERGQIGPFSPDNWISIEANIFLGRLSVSSAIGCDNAINGFVVNSIGYDSSVSLREYGVTFLTSFTSYGALDNASYLSYYTDVIDPTVNDGMDNWFQLGCRWLNTTNNKIWVCIDKTVGAAVWREIAKTKDTVFIATVGSFLGEEYSNLGAALQVYEDSEATRCRIVITSMAGFGVIPVTTTKPVHIESPYYAGISWAPGDAVWTHNGGVMYLEKCVFMAWNDVTTGYITITAGVGEQFIEMHSAWITNYNTFAPLFSCAAFSLTFNMYDSEMYGNGLAAECNVLRIDSRGSYFANDIFNIIGSAFFDYDANTVIDLTPGDYFVFDRADMTPSDEARRLLYYTDTVNPGVDDDLDYLFKVGCQWLNTTDNTLWVCLDNTNGAAVWRRMSLHGEDVFFAILGPGQDYTTLGDALQAYEDSDAQYAWFFGISSGSPIYFGAASVTTTKAFQLQNVQLMFDTGNGVWTIDESDVIFIEVNFWSLVTNDASYITRSVFGTCFYRFYRCTLYSEGTVPIFDIPAHDGIFMIDEDSWFHGSTVAFETINGYIYLYRSWLDNPIFNFIGTTYLQIDTNSFVNPDTLLPGSTLDGRSYAQLLRYLTSVSDPTVNDDIDEYISVGATWLNTATDSMFACVDNTAGAAVWKEIPYADKTTFIATIGTGAIGAVGDYPTLGVALLAYEASAAKSSLFILVDNITFGTASIITTKHVSIESGVFWLLSFVNGDGVWTFDGELLRLYNLNIDIPVTNTTSYITSTTSITIQSWNVGITHASAVTPWIVIPASYVTWFAYAGSMSPLQKMIEVTFAFITAYDGGWYEGDIVDASVFWTFALHSGSSFEETVNPLVLAPNGIIYTEDKARYLKYYIAAVDPGVNDDKLRAFQVGCRWLNTTNNSVFVCLNNLIGVAVWQKLSWDTGAPFVATVGSTSDYATLDLALQALESSDAKYGVFYIEESVNYGTNNVTSTKPVKLISAYGSGYEIAFAAGSGIWTYDSLIALYIESTKLHSIGTNDGGYLTTSLTNLRLFLQDGYIRCSNVTWETVVANASTVYVLGFNSGIRGNSLGRHAVVGNIALIDLYVNSIATDDPCDGLVGALLSYDSSITTFNNSDIDSFNPVSEARFLKYYVSVNDPTVNDDDTLLFLVGCRWLNIISNKIWVCLNDSTGAAVWQKLSWEEDGVFVATLGAAFDYATLDLALQALEASDAKAGVFYVMQSVSYGTNNVTTTKPLKIIGGYLSHEVISFVAGSGIWTYNNEIALYIESVRLASSGTNDGGYLTTGSTELRLFLNNGSIKCSNLTWETIRANTAIISIIGYRAEISGDGAGRHAVLGNIVVLEMYDYSILSTNPCDGVASASLVYDSSLVISNTVDIDTYTGIDKARFLEYYRGAADPTVNDDDTELFRIGCRWLNTTDDKVWVCLDNSTGAAVWTEIQFTSKSIFAATIGSAGDYTSVGAAFQALEDSEATQGSFYLLEDTGFGTSNVTTSKPMTIYDNKIVFYNNDGIWTNDSPRVVFHKCTLLNDTANTTGYITTTITWMYLYFYDGGISQGAGASPLINFIDCPASSINLYVHGGTISSVAAHALILCATLSFTHIMGTLLVVNATFSTTGAARYYYYGGVSPTGFQATTLFDNIYARSDGKFIEHHVAASDPTVSDDEDYFFNTGARWINSLNNDHFVCLDNTAGAAVWKKIKNEDLSIFHATVGGSCQYSNLSAALSDFENSDAERAEITILGTANFGTANITTTKPIKLIGGSLSGNVVQWITSNGIWTLSGDSRLLRLENVKLYAHALSNTGYIDSDGIVYVYMRKSYIDGDSATQPVFKLGIQDIVVFLYDDARLEGTQVAISGAQGVLYAYNGYVGPDSIFSFTGGWSERHIFGNSDIDAGFTGAAAAVFHDTKAQYIEYYTSASAPTVNDDVTDFFQVGCRWIDTVEDRVWTCFNNTATAAVWRYDPIYSEGVVSPNGVVTGRRHDNYYDTVGATFYKCTSSPTGTVWVAI